MWPEELTTDSSLKTINLKSDPYLLKATFKNQWRYKDGDDRLRKVSIRGKRSRESSETPELSLEEDSPESNATSDEAIRWAWDYCHVRDAAGKVHNIDDLSYKRKIGCLISSSLLLYRLIAIFGAPPQYETGIHTSIWVIPLYWKDDTECSIEFMDHKGYCTVGFEGCQESALSATCLVDWLLSNTVPHPYNYTIAGRSA